MDYCYATHPFSRRTFNQNQIKEMNTHEPMTDEHALQYAIEALCDLDVQCTTEEERAELSETIQTLESMKKSYEDCTFGFLTLDDEEDNNEQA